MARSMYWVFPSNCHIQFFNEWTSNSVYAGFLTFLVCRRQFLSLLRWIRWPKLSTARNNNLPPVGFLCQERGTAVETRFCCYLIWLRRNYCISYTKGLGSPKYHTEKSKRPVRVGRKATGPSKGGEQGCRSSKHKPKSQQVWFFIDLTIKTHQIWK
jgi:hypothetical protein